MIAVASDLVPRYGLAVMDSDCETHGLIMNGVETTKPRFLMYYT